MIDPSFIPETAADLEKCLGDWRWRIFSGYLYYIKDKNGTRVPFKPNESQRKLLDNLNHRNVILKARQMGFSTLIEIMALDHALFNMDQVVEVICHTEKAAQKLFKTKVLYAYDNLPRHIRDRFPTSTRSKSELEFKHSNSTITVSVSSRGGTVNFLHVSEMGKIAARYPDKALEISTGSLQAVPENGFCFIESTAEGTAGIFFEMAKTAENDAIQRKNISPVDYQFHFYAWYEDAAYRSDYRDVIISAKDHEYFDNVEMETGHEIDLNQRAWYIRKRDTEFSSDPTMMWREYPSTAKECWQSNTEGKYLVYVLRKARKEERIGKVPYRSSIPVNSFWDLGASDDLVCWLHQHVNGNDHWIGYREATGEGFLPMIRWMESHEYIWGNHYLPHDASHAKQDVETITSTLTQVRELRKTWEWVMVPRIQNIQHGIDLMRADFDTYYFNEETTKDGITHLENYSREYNQRLQTFTNMPKHDEHSHAADAIRQKAQGFQTNTKPLKPRDPSRRSGLVS